MPKYRVIVQAYVEAVDLDEAKQVVLEYCDDREVMELKIIEVIDEEGNSYKGTDA